MKNKVKLSVLDLCPILSQQNATDAYKNAVSLARFVESLNFERYWMAEHHNMNGIGSSAPEVLIAHVAGATEKIRVGSGGIMLPNHASLHIAEIFKTLEALYPGRIDLGVGRAPGSGSRAAAALRGTKSLGANEFPQQFDDLIHWLSDSLPEGHPFHGVSAIPLQTNVPEVWMLGSSDFGAHMAANLGLPYSFAQHFSHMPAIEIFRLYQENFRPSQWLKKPKAMMGTHIICADTDEEAQDLALSSDLSFSIFVQSGKSIPLPTVQEAKAFPYTKNDWQAVRASSMPKFVGSPDKIKKLLLPYVESGLIEELMVLTMVYDQEARKKSYQLLNDIFS